MNLKDLKLHLPDEQAIKNSLVSTNTSKLKQELEQLPYGNMLQALDQVIEKLALMNKTQISTNLRFEILDCFLPPFQMFFDHLTSSENRKQSENSNKTRDKFSHFCQEMSFGYKLALLTFPENNRFKTKKLAERVYYATVFSAITLLIEFQKHQTKTASYWSDIHQLYAYARSKKLLEHTIEFEVLDTLSNSIEGLYLQISITAISNPYQLPSDQTIHIWNYLSQHSHHANITVLEPNSAPESGFVIKYKGDEKPQSYRWFEQATDMLALDLSPLNARLDEHLQTIKANPDSNIAGLAKAPPEIRSSLLNHLADSWLQTSQRSEERVPTEKTIEFTYGVRDVHCVVSHSVDTVMQIREQISDPLIGQITDESTSGACVLLSIAPKRELAPGQLVLMYENHMGMIQAPKLAMVRWNTTDETGQHINLGIKYIPGQIYPISVKANDKVTVDTYPRNGLLLQSVSDLAQEWQIVTTPGLHQENRKLGILFDGQPDEQPAQADQLIVNSKDIQFFSIEILAPVSE